MFQCVQGALPELFFGLGPCAVRSKAGEESHLNFAAELGQRCKTGKGESADLANGRVTGVFSTWENPILEPAKLFFPPLVVIFPSFLPGVVESLANANSAH